MNDLDAAQLLALPSLLGLDVITQEPSKKYLGLAMASKTTSISCELI